MRRSNGVSYRHPGLVGVAVWAVYLLWTGIAGADTAPLPSGTRLIYDNFECTVSQRTGSETICSLASGEGALSLFGHFLDYGRLAGAGPVAALTSSGPTRFRAISLDGNARSQVQQLLPPQVGKSVDYRFGTDIEVDKGGWQGQVISVYPTIAARIEVVGTETLEYAGSAHEVLVITEVTRRFAIADKTYNVLARTWWYDPALGVVAKAHTAWIRGLNSGWQAESRLVDIDWPDGFTPASVTVPPGPEAAAPAGDAPDAEPRLGRAGRLAVQRNLATLGLYDHAIDGVFGLETRRSIRSFQTANGHAPSGSLTAEQVALLDDRARAARAAIRTAATAAEDDLARALAGLEPIDATYEAIEPASVLTRPHPAAPRLGRLAAGEHISVLGRLPDQAWYVVSRDAQPIGFVAAPLLQPVP